MKMTWGWYRNGAEATLADIQSQVGKGWGDILERLVIDLANLGWNGEVMQVKEKFGVLCFYVGASNAAIRNRIDQAGEESAITCEWCGQLGSVDERYHWMLTLCPQCSEKRRVDTELREAKALERLAEQGTKSTA